MSEEVRTRIKGGEAVPVGSMKIPMVDLPLGATEDRVCGTIDIEKALTEGVKAFEPGLLAKANRGILYVDEVNLLDDHLVSRGRVDFLEEGGVDFGAVVVVAGGFGLARAGGEPIITPTKTINHQQFKKKPTISGRRLARLGRVRLEHRRARGHQHQPPRALHPRGLRQP
jgi:hypothetical protein